MTLRRWRERVAVTPALTPNKTHKVELGVIKPERDGRPVHLLSLDLACEVTYDASGAGGAGSLPGPYTRACLSKILLESGDHRWIDSLDGDEVHFLSERRAGGTLGYPIGIEADDPSAIAEAAAAGGTYDASEETLLNELRTTVIENRLLSIELKEKVSRILLNREASDVAAVPDVADAAATMNVNVHYLCSRLGDSLWDGAIPVALLDEKAGSNGLTLTIGGTFKGFAGFTITSVVVTVWATLCTRDELRAPTPHTMRAWDDARKDILIRPKGRVLTCVIRDTKDADDATQGPDHSGYDGLALTLDNEVLFHGYDAAELASEYFLRQERDELRSFPSAAEFLPISVAKADEKRTNMHSGPMRFEIQTRKDAADALQNNSRILLHETGRNTSPAMANYRAILGAPEKGTLIEPRFTTKGTRDASHPLTDVLDQAVYFPGMKRKFGEVPAKKLHKKLTAAK